MELGDAAMKAMRETRRDESKAPSLTDRLSLLQRQHADTSYAASLAERSWQFFMHSPATDRVQLLGARTRFETLRARQWKLELQIQHLESRLAH